MYADAELTTALPNPIILDASGEALFYSNGQALKWILRDAQDVLQWEIDPVHGTGTGSAAAGVGWGKNTVRLQPASGAAQASAVLFPADVLAMAVTVWCSQTVGTSQGLSHVGVGTPDLPDAWGVVPAMLLDATTTAGVVLHYGGHPMPQSGTVTLTAYGGLFDGTGEFYVTGHFVTFLPGHEEGYLYSPSTPAAGQILPPLPVASVTVAGIVELATSAETTTGTDGTRAVTPLGLAAKLPAGTALSVARFAGNGQALEATPGLVTTAGGALGVGATPASGIALQVAGTGRLTEGIVDVINEGEVDAKYNLTQYHATRAPGISGFRARGTLAAPVATQAGDVLLRISGRGNPGGAFIGAFQTSIDFVATETQTASARGSRLAFVTTLTGTVSQAERLQIDGQGNLTTWGALCGLGTSLTATLGSGASYQTLTVKGSTLYVGQTGVQERPMAGVSSSWVNPTDANRTARLTLSAYDATAGREGLRIEADLSAARLSFYGGPAVVKPTVSGAKGGNAALTSLLTALSSLGLVTDSTTA